MTGSIESSDNNVPSIASDVDGMYTGVAKTVGSAFMDIDRVIAFDDGSLFTAVMEGEAR